MEPRGNHKPSSTIRINKIGWKLWGANTKNIQLNSWALFFGFGSKWLNIKTKQINRDFSHMYLTAIVFLTDHASAIVGTTARLRCRIDGRSCGAMHSIKWYKSESRLYVYSIAGNTAIDRPEGPMKDRWEHNEKLNKVNVGFSFFYIFFLFRKN